MKIAFTGHVNIEKACGFSIQNAGDEYNKEAYDTVKRCLENVLIADVGVKRGDTIITGMARGVDEIAADIAMDFGLNLICAVPGSVRWHENRSRSKGIRAQAIHYGKIIAYELATVAEISKNYASKEFEYANFARNQYMVDEADVLVAFKRYNSVGTDDCIARADAAGKNVIFA